MENYRYALRKQDKKERCPSCGSPKKFRRYVDVRANEYLPAQYGRCDREISCGYHLHPYQDGYGKTDQQKRDGWARPMAQATVPKPNCPLPYAVLKQTRKGYEQNTFIQNLLQHVPYPFTAELVERAVGLYHLGTVSKGAYMLGACTFPFIDINGHVRAIQAKTFDTRNHTASTNFIHSIAKHNYEQAGQRLPDWLSAYMNNETKVSCLFGEHLLRKYPYNPIALVEAPKTAIYATLYFGFPDSAPNKLLWLAVYNLSSLSLEKCRVLQGRKVYLFPDLSKDGKAHQLWSEKAAYFNQSIPNAQFSVSNLLETQASQADKEKGLDMADYLIRLDWRNFRKQNRETVANEVRPMPDFDAYISMLHFENGLLMADGYPASWDLPTDGIDHQTKSYIEMVIENPALLKLQQRFSLDHAPL